MPGPLGVGVWVGHARKELRTVALTAKQVRFVEEYLVDLNATQAAVRAGYSAATAYSIGHQCLKKLRLRLP